MKRIGMASDHAGFGLKAMLRDELRREACKIVDFGARTFVEADDFPDYVIPLAKAVAQGEIKRGIAICGSGVGACVAANKVRGVRAGICHDTYSAHQGVEHDDMNVLVLGARIIGPELARELVRAFLNAEFDRAERHQRRLDKLNTLEETR